jgi:fructose-bisphosphate aldolase class II
MAFMMKHAKENHYGIPAFNVWDLGSIRAAELAAEQEDAPVILAGAESHMKYGGENLKHWAALAIECAENSSVPMAVHLDHGRRFELAMQCIRLGFTSVMIDSSALPYEENAAIAKSVVDAAHAVGVTVEAELGHVGSGMDKLTKEMIEESFTKPDEAVRFVEETGVDALAVAVGNLHGLYKFEPNVDMDLLATLCEKVPAYIVMHGGSGTPDLDQAVKLGVTKVNIGTDIGVAFRKSVAKTLKENPLEQLSGLSILQPSIEAMKEVMVGRIRQFGCNGQASKMMAAA